MSLQYIMSVRVDDKEFKLSASGETVYYNVGYGSTTLSGVRYKNGAFVDSSGKVLTEYELIQKIRNR